MKETILRNSLKDKGEKPEEKPIDSPYLSIKRKELLNQKDNNSQEEILEKLLNILHKGLQRDSHL